MRITIPNTKIWFENIKGKTLKVVEDSKGRIVFDNDTGTNVMKNILLENTLKGFKEGASMTTQQNMPTLTNRTSSRGNNHSTPTNPKQQSYDGKYIRDWDKGDVTQYVTNLENNYKNAFIDKR